MSFYGNIRNALTGFIHIDKRMGSSAELEFYRVMPEGQTTKLFFENSAQYAQWRILQYLETDPGLDGDQRDALAEHPFDFFPAAFRTDFLSTRSGTHRHVVGVDPADV